MSTTRLSRRHFHTGISRRWLLICAAVSVLIALPASVRAQNVVNWNVLSGDWSVASNWDSGVLPTSSDDAYIANGGTVNITTIGPVCNNLWLGESTNGTVNMTAGSLSTVGQYIGDNDIGNFTQSGGTDSTSSYFSLGSNYIGTYNLSGSGLLSCNGGEVIGDFGTGIFTQSGGTNTSGGLIVGSNYGASGTYNLSGSGLLSCTGGEVVGAYDPGTFTQSGGTNSISVNLLLGSENGASGSYTLSGSGLLSVSGSEFVGYGGAGNFTQSGGTNVAKSLYLGRSAVSGTYSLSGLGLLSVSGTESLGLHGTFTQTGGENTAAYLSIANGGRYQLDGGTLQINTSLINSGTFDGGNRPGTLSANCLVNMTSGTWQNLGSTTLDMSSNGLLVVPAGFNAATHFGSYSSLGLTYTMGSTFMVPAGRGFSGKISINDLVNCQGMLTASPSGAAISLNNGLVLSGTGAINLGSGSLTVNDATSGIASGSLSASNQYIGKGGTGSFTQSGGANGISSTLYLGYNAGDSGTYNLNGSGLLTAPTQYVGYSGKGNFTQSGGTNSVSNSLYFGYNSSGSMYNLSGSGLLAVSGTEYVGTVGVGSFTQSGGTNSIASQLYLGYNKGNGTYNLSGSGLLSVTGTEYVGTVGVGSFTQSGGTNSIASYLSLGSPSGGNGTYNLSGAGLLSVSGTEYIGAGIFTQTGGVNATAYLTIGSPYFASYQLDGGTLQVNAALSNGGVFDGGNSPGTLIANGVVDMTQGTWQNMGSITVSMSSNGLLIVPARFNPSTSFASYSSLGLTYTTGSTFMVPAGKGFSGQISINDPVICQGMLTASPSGAAINLNNGLMLSGTGTINLGSGSLTVNDTTSGITGGLLTTGNETIGQSSTAIFTQTGGTNAITNSLSLGTWWSTNNVPGGTYNLGGSGLLSVSGTESVGGNNCTATFTQTGGANTTACLSLFAGGTYLLGGGTLQVGNGGLVNSGVFNGGSSTATLIANGIVNMTSGTWQNLGATTVSMSSNGLLIVPAGFDASTTFGAYSSLGLTYTTGSTFMVPAGRGFNGQISINDPVNCQGSIAASPSGTAINFNNGLTLSGTGLVNLGTGYLMVSDTTSGMSGGTLTAASEYIGVGGSGQFTQSGGANTANYLGIWRGGTYLFSGGTLQVAAGNLINAGVFDGGNGPGTLNAGGLLDMTSGTWQNLGAMSVNMGANSLLLLPAGFSGFGSYSSLGLTHTAGTTFVVPAGKGFSGDFSMNDPVNCQGMIAVSGPNWEAINFNNGLMLSGTGVVNLGSGNLTVNDTTSGITGGSLSAANQYVGKGGTGQFTQAGGSNTISGTLGLGLGPADSGTYNLSGTARLSATNEYVGVDPAAAALFQQTGGANTTNYLQIGSGGRYQLSAGTLTIPSGGELFSQGTFDGGNGQATLSIGSSCILDLSQGALTNAGAMNVNMGANGLTILPAGFTGFAHYSSAGVTCTAGTTITLSAGQSISVNGSINEPVACQGTITPASTAAAINLNNGLILSGTGNVNLGQSYQGTLTVNDPASGMSGGTLMANNQYIGSSGTGTFTQTGGINSGGFYNGAYQPGGMILYLGYSSSGNGTYNLSGSGELSSFGSYASVIVGYSGTGTFNQLGGTNAGSGLTLGCNQGSVGTYNLTGGYLYPGGETVGYSGTGTFTQSGGINSLQGSNNYYDYYWGPLQIGANSGGSGTYILTGTGLLSCWGPEDVGIGGGSGTFTQAGGTNAISYIYALVVGNGGGSGAYTLSGSGLLSADGIECIGLMEGTGIFTQSGGTNLVYGYGESWSSCLFLGSASSNLYYGSYALNNGTYNLSGGLLSCVYGEYVGYQGIGTFTQSGGTNAMAYGGLSVGGGEFYGEGNGSGTYILSGGLLSCDYSENVGYGGTGIFTQSGGTNTIAQGGLGIGNGIYNLSGGLLSTTGISIGGTFTQSGGSNIVTGVPYSGGLSVGGSSAMYALSGSGLLSAPFEQIEGNFTQSGGTNIVTCASTNSSNSSYANGLSIGGGTYTLSGSGLLTCSGTESVGYGGTGTFTQSGGTNIAGTLYLANDPYSPGTYNLNGGLLSLTALSAGSGAAVFNFTGGTLQASGGTTNIAIPLNGAAVIDTNGQSMTILGLVTTTGLTALNFDLTAPGGDAPLVIGPDGLVVAPSTAISFGSEPTTLGDYRLIGGDIGTPDLTRFDLPAAPAGERYSLSMTVDPGYIDLVVAVPEPSTLVLLGVGAIALAGCFWRRKLVCAIALATVCAWPASPARADIYEWTTDASGNVVQSSTVCPGGSGVDVESHAYLRSSNKTPVRGSSRSWHNR